MFRKMFSIAVVVFSLFFISNVNAEEYNAYDYGTLYGRLRFNTSSIVSGGHVFALDENGKILSHYITVPGMGKYSGWWKLNKLPIGQKVYLVGFLEKTLPAMAFAYVEVKPGYHQFNGWHVNLSGNGVGLAKDSKGSFLGLFTVLTRYISIVNNAIQSDKRKVLARYLLSQIQHDDTQQIKVNWCNFIVDKYGLCYREWPFTFNGLTVGKIVTDAYHLPLLFPKGELTKSKMKLVLESIRSHKINPHNISEGGYEAIQYHCGKPYQTRDIVLKGPSALTFVYNCLDFIDIIDSQIKHHILSGEIITELSFLNCSLVQVMIKSTRLPKPIPDTDISKVIKKLGPPDLKLTIHENSAIYIWNNIFIQTSNNNIDYISIGASPYSFMGPIINKKYNFGMGRILPLLDMYKLFKEPKNVLIAISYLKSMNIDLKIQNSFAIGVFLQALIGSGIFQLCDDEDRYNPTKNGVYAKKLLGYVLPGVDLKGIKFYEFSIYPPNEIFIEELGITLKEDNNSITYDDITKIYGKPDTIKHEKYGEREFVIYIYKKLRMRFVFKNNILFSVNATNKPRKEFL